MKGEWQSVGWELRKLSEEWRARARRKFLGADREPDAAGKRLIEHGATCYFNCSEDLRKLASALRLSPTPQKPRGRTKRPA